MRFRFYLCLMDLICTSGVLRLVGVDASRIKAFSAKPEPKSGVDSVTWFHASSAGELEMLMPIILGFANQQKKIALSVFSNSAINAVKKVSDQLSELVVFADFSPRESLWQSTLQAFGVKRVIVAKYEAWPALWAACSVLDLPLIVVNAQPRSSLIWVKRALSFFGITLPRLKLFAVDEGARKELKTLFAQASIEIATDPRWARVIERSKDALHHPKVEFYRKANENRAKPFGILGSAWLEDLVQVVPAFKSAFAESATLWIVPHSLNETQVQNMRDFLERELSERYVLVTEMGFLAELYSLADWVWVGGGFKNGIHSTIEPAVFNVPIACGPKNVEQFYETQELRASGLLTVCRNRAEIVEWLEGFQVLKAVDLGQKTRSFLKLLNECMEAR